MISDISFNIPCILILFFKKPGAYITYYATWPLSDVAGGNQIIRL